MTPAVFSTIGRLLYAAPGWRTALAGDLGVSTRTIARYLDGERQIPDDVVWRLRRVADLRHAEIEAAMRELRAAGVNRTRDL